MPPPRYFLRKLRKVKKANGQILAINEIFERNPTTVKNYGIWVRRCARGGEGGGGTGRGCTGGAREGEQGREGRQAVQRQQQRRGVASRQ